MKKPLKEEDLAMIINNRTLNDYLDKLQMLACSLFHWKNLDKHFGFGASRSTELNLFNYGKSCFVKDNELGYLALEANPDDKFNINKLPTKIYATSYEYHKIYNLEDIVYVMNNILQRPTSQFIEMYAYRLYNTERTIDINLNAQKTPILIEGDAKTMLTLKNIYLKFDGNCPVIYGNKNFNFDNKLNVLKTDAPFVVDKLDIHKHQVFNDALTFLGINNSNTDKKERLITDEVESNEEVINYYLNCFYSPRKEACDELNRKFGFTGDDAISIELNKDVVDLLNDTYSSFEEGDDIDGSLYNNDTQSIEK